MTTSTRPSLASTHSTSISDAGFGLQMGPLESNEQFVGDLTRLRADALVMLGWITGFISYICLIFLVWPITGGTASPIAWVGTLTLMVVSGMAVIASRRNQRMARYLYAVGINLVAACGMVTLGQPEGAFLFLLPIIVAFLFTQKYFIRGIALTGLKS